MGIAAPPPAPDERADRPMDAPGYRASPEERAYAEAAPGLARAPERRAYAQPYESLTFSLFTHAQRELTVTLAAQAVFDLSRSAPVARRVRRLVRHQGGERALLGLGRRTLELTDLHRIDALTLAHSLEMLRLAPRESGVLPAYWRTVASSRGRFALLCAQQQPTPSGGALMVEVSGGVEQAPPEAIAEAIAHFETAAQSVILRIAPDPAAARRLVGVGARCLSIDFAGVEHDDARSWRAAADLVAAARQTCDHVLLLNLRPDRGLAAHAAGATHAVFSGMEPLSI